MRLLCDTPREWVQLALERFDEVLVDHAHCEKKAAGVAMNAAPSTIIPNPMVHDRSDSILTGAPAPRAEDRIVRYRNGTTTTQRAMTFPAGMSYADTSQFIRYLPEDDPRRLNFVTGTVDMAGYLAWLDAHGYGLGMSVARR